MLPVWFHFRWLNGCQKLSTFHFSFKPLITFLLQKRCIYKHALSLNQTHLSIFKLLIQFSTSLYSKVRIPAQNVLGVSFNTWACSYKFVLDDILQYIGRNSNATHEQLKGSLYLLYNGRNRSIALRQDFPTLLRIWPVLVDSQYSEKPSIVALMDGINDMLIGQFASFEIYYSVSLSRKTLNFLFYSSRNWSWKKRRICWRTMMVAFILLTFLDSPKSLPRKHLFSSQSGMSKISNATTSYAKNWSSFVMQQTFTGVTLIWHNRCSLCYYVGTLNIRKRLYWSSRSCWHL
jgi:hypothetical protein